MIDIAISKEFIKRQCVYLLNGVGNHFNMLFSTSEKPENCSAIINTLTRDFSKLYFDIEYCENPKCPCHALYSINSIRNKKGFPETIDFIEKDNKELFSYLQKVFTYFDE